MQEFESISASSYDPSALATKLTAKAAEGWSVVAIVPTGGDVTAYVSRERDGGAETKTAAEPAEAEQTPVEKAIVEAAKPEPEKIEAEKKPEVSEPSGWAIAPEPASPTPEPAASAEPTTTYQPSLSATTAAATPATAAPTPTPTPAPAATPAAATPAAAPTPTPAVPAGWYADPAGRFELRYWDGGTWTEHVSRAGQQFTDPPVA
ncbi:MAG: DUF2510 domain-containing protein [Ilumatobacteraceae bacterium]